MSAQDTVEWDLGADDVDEEGDGGEDRPLLHVERGQRLLDGREVFGQRTQRVQKIHLYYNLTCVTFLESIKIRPHRIQLKRPAHSSPTFSLRFPLLRARHPAP